MSEQRHHYQVTVEWEGATERYDAYSRDHRIVADGRPDIPGSADPSFRGDPARWNPEQLLVASLSACHKLWFLHLASEAGLVVTRYEDAAEGWMSESEQGGHFDEVILHPQVTLASGDASLLAGIHHHAHARCFVAASMNFPVTVEPR